MFEADSQDDTIYLDYAATTSVHPDVLAEMLPYFSQRYGNPSSIYRLGQEAHAAIDEARSAMARVLGCVASEIVFTSGATESINLALKGVAWHQRMEIAADQPPHIVTTTIEHHAGLHATEALARQGFEVTYVPCDATGIVAADAVVAAIRPETCLVSVMYANNEVGAIQPIAAIGQVTRRLRVPFHTDACQAAGALPLNVDALGVDLLSLSAHKFYGPKGVGLLYVRRGTRITFQQDGGGQESGRRGGTEAVPLIVGLAVALERAERLREASNVRSAGLRDRFWARLRDVLSDVLLNGPNDPSLRLANNLNIAFEGVQGETVLLALDMEGIAASAGSACTTGNSEPSHVLRAMGLAEERCRASLRFSVGRETTTEEIDETINVLVDVVARVRALSGVA